MKRLIFITIILALFSCGGRQTDRTPEGSNDGTSVDSSAVDSSKRDTNWTDTVVDF